MVRELTLKQAAAGFERFWRDDTLIKPAFGDPLDPAYWETNKPASIAKANPDKIRATALQIYLDCGDEDMFPVI